MGYFVDTLYLQGKGSFSFWCGIYLVYKSYKKPKTESVKYIFFKRIHNSKLLIKKDRVYNTKININKINS